MLYQGTNCEKKYEQNPDCRCQIQVWSWSCQVLEKKNNGKQLSCDCGRWQRDHPFSLLWLLAVSLAANSLLIYTTAAIHNPNKPETSNYVRLTRSAYHGGKTEKMLTTKANISGPVHVCCGLVVDLLYYSVKTQEGLWRLNFS